MVNDAGRGVVWTGDTGPAISTPVEARAQEPLTYTPSYLAEKILTSKSALEGERKQVTVLFADLKDSTELIRGLDPEAARRLLDPALHRMMDAVHRLRAPSTRCSAMALWPCLGKHGQDIRYLSAEITGSYPVRTNSKSHNCCAETGKRV